MTSPSDLDPGAVERLKRLGGAKLLAEMIRLFGGYGAEKLAAARDALNQGDLVGVEKAVHPLKSSAGNVGAARVQELAAQAELAAREQQSETLPGQLDALESAFKAVLPLLEAERDKETSSSDGG